ncbi:hypothetical protein BDZ89DRAFT_569528 [Hymenopellis radicata]|nr:hypothetical protein BDZ89DRAFT_569528 [Hymenopellis radicata]
MGLRAELSESRQWRLNGLLVNPVVLLLATWFAKKHVERMLIKVAVEEIGSFAHVVAVETKRTRRACGAQITWAILLETNDDSRVEPTVLMKGVQMDIVSQAEGDEPDTTATLAVSVVPQLLLAWVRSGRTRMMRRGWGMQRRR